MLRRWSILYGSKSLPTMAICIHATRLNTFETHPRKYQNLNQQYFSCKSITTTQEWLTHVAQSRRVYTQLTSDDWWSGAPSWSPLSRRAQAARRESCPQWCGHQGPLRWAPGPCWGGLGSLTAMARPWIKRSLDYMIIHVLRTVILIVIVSIFI